MKYCWAVVYRRRWLVAALAIVAVVAVLLAPPLNTGHGPAPGETPTPYPPPSSGRNGH